MPAPSAPPQSGQGSGADRVEMERPPCLLCGAGAAETVLEGSDRLHELPGLFGVARCSNCGHLFTRPRPKDLRPYYPSDYGPHKRGVSKRSPAFVHRMMLAGFLGYPGPRFAARALLWPLWPFWRASSEYARVIPWTGRGRLLDFGCGSGQFLVRMTRLGWTVAGLELSADAVVECRARGLDVRPGTFPDASIPDASFDVVTLWESLEHVPNPRETVAEARRILAPGGRIVISLPLCDSLAFEWLGADWYSLDLPRHLSHFRRDTLERLLREQGFEDVRFRARRSPNAWRFSFARRFASKRRRLDEWLSRSKRACALIELGSCILGRPGTVVVLARKPLVA